MACFEAELDGLLEGFDATPAQSGGRTSSRGAVLKRPAAATGPVLAREERSAMEITARSAEPVLQLPQVEGDDARDAALTRTSRDEDQWPLTKYFARAWQLLLSEARALPRILKNDPFGNLMGYVFHSRQDSHKMSKSAMSAGARVDRHRVRPYLLASSCTLLYLDRFMRLALERSMFTLPPGSVWDYDDYCRQDETPLSVVRATHPARSHTSVASADPGDSMAIVRSPTNEIVLHTGLALPFAAPSVSTPSKVVQSESSFGMLMDLGGELLVIRGVSLTMPQLVDRCTAKTLLEAERRRRCVGDAPQIAAHRCRGHNHDRAGQNLLGEVNLVHSLNRGCELKWHRSGLFCEPHMTFGNAKKKGQARARPCNR